MTEDPKLIIRVINF